MGTLNSLILADRSLHQKPEYIEGPFLSSNEGPAVIIKLMFINTYLRNKAFDHIYVVEQDRGPKWVMRLSQGPWNNEEMMEGWYEEEQEEGAVEEKG